MKYKAPEARVKNEILSWLSGRPDCMAWPNDSTGIWDPTKKIFRRKNSIFHRKGVADILGIFQGKPLAIETKSSVGRLSPEQEKFLGDFATQGGIAILARSLVDVIKILDPKAILDIE